MGSTSGGGIVRGGGGSASTTDDMRAFRRRWASGVVVVTVVHDEGFRGATVSGMLPVSVSPPTVVFSFEIDASFQTFLQPGIHLAVSILDRGQEFLAERFAGRAPVPDSTFTGVPHEVVQGLPLLRGAIGHAIGKVTDRIASGDHLLVTADLTLIDIPPDTDDPMVLFETRYRSLEIS
jgi:flavin reductase (DIM6/NTAB) family NADH-FMN oxidoreductase RutF